MFLVSTNIQSISSNPPKFLDPRTDILLSWERGGWRNTVHTESFYLLYLWAELGTEMLYICTDFHVYCTKGLSILSKPYFTEISKHWRMLVIQFNMYSFDSLIVVFPFFFLKILFEEGFVYVDWLGAWVTLNPQHSFLHLPSSGNRHSLPHVT